MRPFRPLILTAVAVVGLGLASPPASAGLPAARPLGNLAAASIAQIDALAAAKRALTPAQRKIDSRLLAETRMRRKLPVAAGVRKVRTGVAVDRSGRAQVTVRGRVDDVLLARIKAMGGQVRASYPKDEAVRADVPLAAVEALAAAGGVTRVSVADRPVTHSPVTHGPVTDRPDRTPAPASKEVRAERLRTRVAAALDRARADGRLARSAPAGATPRIGAVTSEGDAAHAAAAARSEFGVSGVGIKIGVLSDGVDSLSASIASGDLPAGTEVLPGQAGAGDEGTAMLEIVHDIAPKADLAFATAFESAEGFAQNIRDLRAAGCDIIVDDIIYFSESPFQDGPIAQAVIDVTNDGALYFSSAGNEGNVTDGTSGNWEGDFVSSGRTIGKFAGTAHDFAPGPAVQVVDPVTPGSAGVPALLQWADPLGASGNDYDLYALEPDGDVAAFSNDVQDGDDIPFEGFFLPDAPLAYRLAVVKFSGADRYFQLTAFRGRFASTGALTGFSTPGVTRGHSAVPAAFSIAAAPAAAPWTGQLEPDDPPNPAGPFPGAFTADQRTELFTADGPRRVFFEPDGTPVTPGNVSSTGGTVRAKPDLTGADGVVTTVPGFGRFFGTSAAAPHVAALAALVLSGNPGLEPAEVRSALTETALDIEAPGYDRDTGHGIVLADRLLTATGATPQPLVVPGDAVVSTTTDGDTFVEPGETATVNIPVTNRGDGTAHSVSTRLTTTTPGVTVTPAVRGYDPVEPDETANSREPFTVTVAGSVPLGTTIQLRARVSFVGTHSPQVATSRIVVGEPSNEVVDFAYAGPPVPIPDAVAPGASVPLEVSGVGPVSRVTFSVDGTSCSTAVGATTVGIDHTFVADLVGTLTAPDGTAVTLFDRAGGSGNNICQAVFDDGAARSIQSALAADAPFTGSWRPASPLAALAGHGGDGTWTFSAVDNARVDVGSIRSVTLHLSGYVGAGT